MAIALAIPLLYLAGGVLAVYLWQQSPAGKKASKDLETAINAWKNADVIAEPMNDTTPVGSGCYSCPSSAGTIDVTMETGVTRPNIQTLQDQYIDVISQAPPIDSPCHRWVLLSKSVHPEAAQHVEDAQRSGHPSTLTIDRAGARQRRALALRGKTPVPGKDLDEYPPAMFLEGGPGASVRAISSSDNRSAGAYIRWQTANAPDGCNATIMVVP